jgi:hypothetical protein
MRVSKDEKRTREKVAARRRRAAVYIRRTAKRVPAAEKEAQPACAVENRGKPRRKGCRARVTASARRAGCGTPQNRRRKSLIK